DYAGDLLYGTLTDFGFARGTYEARADDGLLLIGAAITNAVRCVPPENKPKPVEIKACRPFLEQTLKAYPKLRVVLALGRIAHDSTVAALGAVPARYAFAHGKRHDFGAIGLYDSYHCSRYNTNTRRLTAEMFRDVFAAVRAEIDGAVNPARA
ncbi:MAG: uracil-DNA glycosylase, partial [Hyphomicrobiales bacterium]|nr:uracil-DNA glycosylase [Hyphomicrobiales bacterium]